ncbi:MAG: MFS transporter, partial [Mycobacterium sp.]|nr:MFS transporter [Mycobacterium sp.]
MTALNDAERTAGFRAAADSSHPLPTQVDLADLEQAGPSLRSWRFISAVVAIGGMQLLATMDSTVAIV